MGATLLLSVQNIPLQGSQRDGTNTFTEYACPHSELSSVFITKNDSRLEVHSYQH